MHRDQVNPRLEPIMFRIKICGITRVEDARLAADAGADAIGINFCESSPRLVEEKQAHRIVAALPEHVAAVGVFVNRPAADVARLFDQLGLDWIQLHGDEEPNDLRQLEGRPVIRAFRRGGAAATKSGEQPSPGEYLQQCASEGCSPRAVLIDAYSVDAYGGTGRLADWEELTGDRSWLLGLPLVLAGGLTPQNVAGAIAKVQPQAVDTASGVETAPGIKDRMRVEQFVAAALAALDASP